MAAWAAAAAATGAVWALLRRELRSTVDRAIERAKEDAADCAAQDLALQSYYEGGTRLHRKNADDLMLGSGRALAAEVRGCFETIKEIGRGVVYFGSARFEPGSKLYEEGKVRRG